MGSERVRVAGREADSRYDSSWSGMTLIRPCRQSTVAGTRITRACSLTVSSSSLQMMTARGEHEAISANK